MTDEELISEFRNIAFSNGKISSRRVSEDYWIDNNHTEILNLIIQRTSFVSGSPTIRERMLFVESGLMDHPKCATCGDPAMIIRQSKISEFCSVGCSHKDPKKSEKRKLDSKNVDFKLAAEKRAVTMKEKYGVEFNSQRTEIKTKLSESKLKANNDSALEKLCSFEWMDDNYVKQNRTLVDIATELSVYYGTVGDYCRKHGFAVRSGANRSQQETEVGRYLDSIGVSWRPDRIILNGSEIDIFVEEHNFGIEIDGLYWHSYGKFETTKEKYRHLEKTKIAKSNGVSLIHVLDYEWKHKQDIVKSMILSKLGKTTRIFARNCIMREIDSKIARSFLDSNHIQGFSPATIYLGLFYKETLVMLMSFGKPRFNDNYEWELIRSASLLGHSVVGGASRLLSNFRKKYPSASIICYSDRRFGEGSVYSAIGFNLAGETKPGYFWTDGDKIWNRMKFQRSKLKDQLPLFDQNKSEAENMFANGYRRYWDCGNLKFVIR